MADSATLKSNQTVEIAAPSGTVKISNGLPVVFIAGPCALESRDHALKMSAALSEIAERLGAPLIYKTSFDKANRTSVSSYRGIELADALPIFEAVRKETGRPVLTDVHTAEQCAALGDSVDVLQIPAFLCRQTDLLLAAAATGKAVNVKKGQFLAPWDMQNVVNKLSGGGCQNIMLTERGVSFGYNTLVNDMRALPQMRETGCPVVFDATHSVQQPGGNGTTSGGDRRYAPILANAAAAVGIAAVFMEVHEDPDNAPSDGANMIKLEDAERVMSRIMQIDALAKSFMREDG
ncbi:MAG: 3-deoxy-8-phosphooctulonate synthase [Hyphomonadaceae bacterium]